MEFNGQKPLCAHESWESSLSVGLSRMLRGEKVGGHSSLIICSCSPSLTSSVAKDDPCQLCTSPMKGTHTQTHTHICAVLCPVLLLSKLADRLLRSWMLWTLTSRGLKHQPYVPERIIVAELCRICQCWQNIWDIMSGIRWNDKAYILNHSELWASDGDRSIIWLYNVLLC